MLNKLINDPIVRRQFAIYLVIGGIVLCIDLATLRLCLARGVILVVATTIAYFTGTASHFLLNRYVNFRRFERAIHDQARTFVAIVFFQWLVTLAVVALLVHYGSPPLPARLVAVAVNLPAGFLANRYLTFGVGILPRMKGAWKTK